MSVNYIWEKAQKFQYPYVAFKYKTRKAQAQEAKLLSVQILACCVRLIGDFISYLKSIIMKHNNIINKTCFISTLYFLLFVVLMVQ